MSQENVEVVRAVYGAWSDGELDALLAVSDAGVELWTSGAFPDLAPVYRGYDGIRTFWQSMRVPWESFHLDLERIVEGEDCAAVAVRFRAQGKGSGVATEFRQGHALRLKDGRVFKVSTHMSFDEALEAAGLSEQAMPQENVEIVRRVIDVMDAEGFEAALPVFLDAAHSDVEWREDPAWPGSASSRGVEQVQQVILDRMDTLDFDQQTEKLISVNDKVVALVRWIGRGKTSGAQGEISMAMVWTVRDQAITRIEFFLARAQALAAVGLSE